MKTAVSLAPPILAEPRAASSATWPGAVVGPGLGSRVASFVALVKPRLTLLVLLTVAIGFLLGARRASHPAALLLTVLGTGLVAGGASAWNQYLERARDLLMKRTANRPLPGGRLAPAEVAVFGTALGVAGVLILAWGADPIAAWVALATFVLYVGVYTPLKPLTTLNTAVGAIPGALPPVIGWAAATGRLGIEAWALFLIVFLWQFPHFLAIAWIYRDDYRRAGHRMLPSVDPTGRITGRQAAGYALALVPAGLLPAVIGLAGRWYFAGALAMGVFYLAAAVRFWTDTTDQSARRLLRASFLYLPLTFVLLLLNPLPA